MRAVAVTPAAVRTLRASSISQAQNAPGSGSFFTDRARVAVFMPGGVPVPALLPLSWVVGRYSPGEASRSFVMTQKDFPSRMANLSKGGVVQAERLGRFQAASRPLAMETGVTMYRRPCRTDQVITDRELIMVRDGIGEDGGGINV
jgi:hypothetical protein